MTKVMAAICAIAIVLGLATCLFFLFSWALFACAQGMGMIAVYTNTQIWWGAGALCILGMLFGKNSIKSS